MNREALAHVALNTLLLDPHRAQEAVRSFGGADRVLSAPAVRLQALLPPAAIARRAGAWESGRQELLRAAACGARLLVPGSAAYPESISELAGAGGGAPLVLYARGDLRALALPTVAIVGSRRATPYGLEVARGIARELAERGVAVVSGLARGIDSAAHRGALEARGVTVGVLGSGLLRVYPAEHRTLAEEVARTGLLMTEMPLLTPPLPQNFPRRNRIIAAVADVVVVVEAAPGSGSRHTADAAAALGRTVMAVPGPITSEASRGANLLIRDGAHVVLGVEDVVAALRCSPRWVGRPRVAAAPAASGDRPPGGAPSALLPHLAVEEPRHVDELAERSGLSVPDLLVELGALVASGRARQLPGQLFQRCLQAGGNGSS